MTNPMPCVVCGKSLEPVFGRGQERKAGLNDYRQPAQANTLFGRGTYGSEVFDPLDGSAVRVNICDDCLSRAIENGTAEVTQTES